MNFKRIYEMQLFLTYNCNLQCKYCYEKNFKTNGNISMNKQTIYKSIDFFIKQAKQNSEIYITFLGGEPFLEFDLIKDTIEYINKQNNKSILFQYALTTNGILVDSDIASFLKENKFDISLSIDGCEYSHNLNRIKKNEDGSFYGAMNAIEIFNKIKLNFNARMTICTNTIEYLKANVKWLLDLGVNDIRISPNYFDEWKDEFSDIYKSSYRELSKLYLHYRSFRNIKIDILDEKIRKFLLDGKGLLCSAGYGKFVIGTEEELYPCSFVIGLDDFKIGTLEEGVLTEKIHSIFVKYVDSNNENCNNCKITYFCQGTKCGYVNYKLTGLVNRPSSFICNHEKVLYEVVAELVEEIYLNKNKQFPLLIEALKDYIQVFEPNISIRKEAEKYFYN